MFQSLESYLINFHFENKFVVESLYRSDMISMFGLQWNVLVSYTPVLGVCCSVPAKYIQFSIMVLPTYCYARDKITFLIY